MTIIDEVTAPCKSVRELARRFGRSDTTVRVWRKHKNWPSGVPTRGPWTRLQMVRIAEFVKHLAPDPNPHQNGTAAPGATTLTEIEKKLKQARTAHIELQMSIQRGEYLKRTDVLRWRSGALYAFKAGLRGLAQSLPAELDAAHRQDWTAVLEARFSELCNNFADASDPANHKRRGVRIRKPAINRQRP